MGLPRLLMTPQCCWGYLVPNGTGCSEVEAEPWGTKDCMLLDMLWKVGWAKILCTCDKPKDLNYGCTLLINFVEALVTPEGKKCTWYFLFSSCPWSNKEAERGVDSPAAQGKKTMNWLMLLEGLYTLKSFNNRLEKLPLPLDGRWYPRLPTSNF